MTRLILIVVGLIFIYFLVKFIRLLKLFSSGPGTTIEDQKKHRDDIDKHFRDIEEAKFREISPDEDIDSTPNGASQKKDG
jgi:hypothetical protein